MTLKGYAYELMRLKNEVKDLRDELILKNEKIASLNGIYGVSKRYIQLSELKTKRLEWKCKKKFIENDTEYQRIKQNAEKLIEVYCENEQSYEMTDLMVMPKVTIMQCDDTSVQMPEPSECTPSPELISESNAKYRFKCKIKSCGKRFANFGSLCEHMNDQHKTRIKSVSINKMENHLNTNETVQILESSEKTITSEVKANESQHLLESKISNDIQKSVKVFRCDSKCNNIFTTLEQLFCHLNESHGICITIEDKTEGIDTITLEETPMEMSNETIENECKTINNDAKLQYTESSDTINCMSPVTPKIILSKVTTKCPHPNCHFSTQSGKEYIKKHLMRVHCAHIKCPKCGNAFVNGDDLHNHTIICMKNNSAVKSSEKKSDEKNSLNDNSASQILNLYHKHYNVPKNAHNEIPINPEWRFHCCVPKCVYFTMNILDLKLHLTDCHGNSKGIRYNCPQCSKRYSKMKKLEAHVRSKHGTNIKNNITVVFSHKISRNDANINKSKLTHVKSSAVSSTFVPQMEAQNKSLSNSETASAASSKPQLLKSMVLESSKIDKNDTIDKPKTKCSTVSSTFVPQMESVNNSNPIDKSLPLKNLSSNSWHKSSSESSNERTDNGNLKPYSGTSSVASASISTLNSQNNLLLQKNLSPKKLQEISIFPKDTHKRVGSVKSSPHISIVTAHSNEPISKKIRKSDVTSHERSNSIESLDLKCFECEMRFHKHSEYALHFNEKHLRHSAQTDKILPNIDSSYRQ